jgi:hypothetical protein
MCCAPIKSCYNPNSEKMKITVTSMRVGTVIDQRKENETAHATAGTTNAHHSKSNPVPQKTPATPPAQRSLRPSKSVQ